MSWDASLHPRDSHTQQFTTSDSKRGEVTSAYAQMQAPTAHAEWRGQQMNSMTGWCSPVVIDGEDVANKPFHSLSPNTQQRLVAAIDNPDPELSGFGKFDTPPRIAREVAEHEAAGGSITREGDVVSWRTADGQVGRERGYAVFRTTGRDFYEGNNRLFSVDGNDIAIDDYGRITGDKAKFDDDFRSPYYIAPDGIAWRDGRVMEADHPDFWTHYHNEMDDARGELSARANRIAAS